MIKLTDILQEIGDATHKPYPYDPKKARKKFKHGAVYSFNSKPEKKPEEEPEGEHKEKYEGTSYVVRILKDNDSYGDYEFDYDVSFGLETNSDVYDYTTEVNRGEMYRVMATVMKMIMQELEIDKEEGRLTKRIYIYPTKRPDPKDSFQDDRTDMRRSNLYTAYIRKNAPEGSKMTVNAEGDIQIDLSDTVYGKWDWED